ncbi:MAG: PDGLE domain-containing protein [Chloroflexota bacterium]
MSTTRRLILGGLLIAIVIAASSAFIASGSPDGLERVAQDHGFLDRAQDAPYRVLPDYTVPGLGDGPISTIVAGAVGVVLVAGIALGAGSVLRRRR